MGIPIKHVRWGKLAKATVKQTEKFGPNTDRVKALLKFIPTMSDEAMSAANSAAWGFSAYPAWQRAKATVMMGTRGNPRGLAFINAENAANKAAQSGLWKDKWDVARDAAVSESVADLISPKDRRILSNPLATGRAVDVLKKRYKNESFLRMIKQLGDLDLINSPDDVLTIGRLSLEPSSIQDTALEWMKKDFNTSDMSLRDIVSSAKIL